MLKASEVMELLIARHGSGALHNSSPDRVRRQLQSDNPPDDLLPGRAIWDLRIELRQALKDLSSDDTCLHPRDPVV